MPLFLTSSNGATTTVFFVGQARSTPISGAPAVVEGGAAAEAGVGAAGRTGATAEAGALAGATPANGTTRSTWPTSIVSGLATQALFHCARSRQSTLSAREMLRMVSPGCTV